MEEKNIRNNAKAVVKEEQERKINKARNNLLLVIALTVINCTLTGFGLEWNFAFSATLPPNLFYFYLFFNQTFLLILAIGIIIAYLALYVLSKNHPIFLIFAFILFAFDTFFMILGSSLITYIINLLSISYRYESIGFGISTIIGIVFHAWIWFYLITGIIAWSKLKHTTQIDFQSVYTIQNNFEKQDDTVKCPYCAEHIKKEALICRFCGKELPKEKIENETKVEKDVNSEVKNAEIEELERLFDDTSDENEKIIIAKKLYDLGKLYYWRFIPRDKK